MPETTPPFRRRRLPTTIMRGPRTHQDALSDQHIAGYLLSPAELARPDRIFAPTTFPLHLEIGFGKGEYLFEAAYRSPDTGFIGIELYRDGILALARRLARRSPPCRNIRLCYGDARDLVALIPEAVFSRIILLYPDPWPKRRHYKRRFINSENVSALERILISGGELIILTDIADYADWIQDVLDAHTGFSRDLTVDGGKHLSLSHGCAITRYAHKAKAAERASHHFRFYRR